MPKIKLVDEQIDAIMVKELKKAYKTISQMPYNGSDELNILRSIETMLKYYMIEADAVKWIKKHEE